MPGGPGSLPVISGLEVEDSYPWSKLASQTRHYIELWVSVQDHASQNKVGEQWKIPDVNLRLLPAHVCPEKCQYIYTCMYTMHI